MQNTTEQSFQIEAFTERSITLEFENISLLMNTKYTIPGLNVLLYQVELPQTVLNIHNLDRQNNTGMVTVTNSTFGYMNVTREFDISISDCYINDSSRPPKMVMGLNGCNLSINRSTVYKTAPDNCSMIQATKCKIDMVDVNLIGYAIITIYEKHNPHEQCYLQQFCDSDDQKFLSLYCSFTLWC